MATLKIDQLLQENEELRRRLEEAEQALRAIRAGEVDAVLIEAEREQVLTLETPETPYRLLVAQVPQAAVTLTADGIIISCNRRFADLLQRPSTGLCGRPIRDIAAPDSRAALEALLCDGMTKESRDTITLLRDDGTPVLLYVGISPLREGALGLCMMITDLTEQRRLEELELAQDALRQSEARMARELTDTQLLQRLSAQLVQEDHVEGLYQHLVEAASKLLRSDMASMQIFRPERNELELLAWKGFDSASAEFWKWVGLDSGCTCGAALATGERVVMNDVERSMAPGAQLEAYRRSGVRAVQSTPLRSRTGRPLGVISTHWRTPHRPSERDLTLIDVLARQAADLIERRLAEQALRDADQKKDEFLATLAHELRNPLAPIRNAVEILKAKGPPDPDLLWARGIIDRQLHVMARLLEDLLDVSRITRNKLELRTERVELATVVEAALETSRPVIEGAGHELTIEMPREPIRLDCDPIRLAQVFANLLTNAAKYTEEGGHIQLAAERQGSDAVVSVKDDGMGIAADVLPHVFEIFSQAKPALGRSQGGLGIGLSLVKGLVELHGGSIQARSGGPGQGSEFIVRLPAVLAAPEPLPTPKTPADDRYTVAPRRILIADDNRDSADSLAMILKVLGHEVGTAYDGEQAFEAAAILRPEVVVLDIGMPKLNGYEACRRIREQPWGKDIFLIAVTGWGQEEDRRRTEEAGFDDHMVKPVDPEALTKVLFAGKTLLVARRSAS